MNEQVRRINTAYTDVSELIGRALNQGLSKTTVGKLKQCKHTVALIEHSVTTGESEKELEGAMDVKAEIAEDIAQKAADIFSIAEQGLD